MPQQIRQTADTTQAQNVGKIHTLPIPVQLKRDQPHLSYTTQKDQTGYLLSVKPIHIKRHPIIKIEKNKLE